MEKDKHLSNDNLDIENSLIELAYQRLPLLHASNKSIHQSQSFHLFTFLLFFFSNLKVAIEIFRSFIENVHIKSLETMRQVCCSLIQSERHKRSSVRH